MDGIPTLRAMREKARSDFGERLFQARTHAGLSQPQLARAVGMSQGTLGEAERAGQGSSYTAQIAQVTGVRAEWLATGSGEMLDDQAWPFRRVSIERLLALSESDLDNVEGKLEAAIELAEERAASFRKSPTKQQPLPAENAQPEPISNGQDGLTDDARRTFLGEALGAEDGNAQRNKVGRAAKRPHAGRR